MINPDLFTIKDHPKINPLSHDNKDYYKSEKRKIIEGIWINGIYIPGTLYFFANYWHIKLQRDNGKGEYIGRPRIRDIEFDKHYILLEARGFSGFELDKEFSCDRRYLKIQNKYPNYFLLSNKEIEAIKEDLYYDGIITVGLDFRKKYIPAREYLRTHFLTNLGKPLYDNDNLNIIDIEARATGKSYFASCIIGHNFLLDGATNYDEYLDKVKKQQYLSSETCVGAIDSKYSKDLLNKVKLGIDNLPGRIEYNNKYYPSPFDRIYKGSLEAGKFIEAVREVKINGNWKTEGSRSKIHHRTTMDNPLVFNGTRPNLVCLEEVGFMSNLLEVLGNLRDCTTVDGRKFGSVIAFGTGGDVDGYSTFAAQKVFYNPEKYDCLTFDNVYELQGNRKIGFFVPAYKKLDKFRDDKGVLNEEIAKKYIEVERDKAKHKSQREYTNLIQNNPILPSEAFLVLEGNKFPILDLKNHLGELLADPDILDNSLRVEFKIDNKGNPDKYFSNKMIIRDFPYINKNGTDTAIEIFELPKTDKKTGKVYTNRYIAGWDPTEDDLDSSTEKDLSLQSLLILDMWTDNIVAEYTGRTNLNRNFYEQVRRLLLYYNAECNYEKDKKGPYQHFEQKKCLYLLAKTPSILEERGIQKIKNLGNEAYGTRGTTPVIAWSLDLVQEWLEQSLPDGRKRLQTLRSPALIKELIAYNNDLNADRVRALQYLMILREDRLKYLEVYKDKEKNKDIEEKKDYWKEKFMKPNYYFFNPIKR